MSTAAFIIAICSLLIAGLSFYYTTLRRHTKVTSFRLMTYRLDQNRRPQPVGEYLEVRIWNGGARPVAVRSVEIDPGLTLVPHGDPLPTVLAPHGDSVSVRWDWRELEALERQAIEARANQEDGRVEVRQFTLATLPTRVAIE